MKRETPFTPTSEKLERDLAQARLWTEWPASVEASSHFDVDLISWAAWFYERQEEVIGPTDEHGRYDRRASLTGAPSPQQVAYLDKIALGFGHFISVAAKRAGIEVERSLPWPSGKTFAVALSHDIDNATEHSFYEGMRKVGAAVAAVATGDKQTFRRRLSDARGFLWSPKRHSPHWLMPAMARMEAERGYQATYFVLPHTSVTVSEGPRKARRYAVTSQAVSELLHDLIATGAEVALHTSYDAHDSEEGLAMDLGVLRSALGATPAIRGARSHYLRLLPNETVRRTQAAGLEWDSTFGWARGWGFRYGSTFPYVVRSGTKGSAPLWELGLHIMDVAVSRQELVDAVRDLLASTAASGGAASILVHPNPYGNSTAAEHLRLYEQVLDEVARYDEAWVTTGSNIVDAMKAHRQRITAP